VQKIGRAARADFFREVGGAYQYLCRIGSTCVAHTSAQRGSRDVIASLACVRLSSWPVAWNWRRAVLSADAGLVLNNQWCDVNLAA